MHKVIILRGRGNSGKTTTIRKIYAKLRVKYPEADPMQLGQHGSRELCVIIPTEYDRIGILTIGDPGSNMNELLKSLVDHNCNIIVCAARTRGSTVKHIEQLPVKYIRSWRGQSELSLSELREVSNEAIAELVLDEISVM